MNDSEYCNIQINDSMLKAMYYELIKETRNSNKTISHKPNNFTLFILNSLRINLQHPFVLHLHKSKTIWHTNSKHRYQNYPLKNVF